MSETLAFKTELKQLLHLIIHSLYSHKDIFLRELISNASDTIDRVRFQGLTHDELLEGDADWKIRIVPDAKNRTLTISDNGSGMSREAIVEQLGTIARSGTREFLTALKQADAKDRPELIGQFGVGFYSSFMVADKVTVLSRPAGGKPEDGVRWESDGQGEFSVEPYTKEKRGSDVILHLKEEDKDFLESHRLRDLVKKYSDFVEHPIELVTTQEDGTTSAEIVNARKAIWLRAKSEVTQEEYSEFYKHLARDHQDPLQTIHYRAEGQLEFRALLFIPAHKPYDLMWGESSKGLHLYIQRVFILDDVETLLPRYLRFVRGVVDTPDLPLNVSREILQHSAPLEKIRSNLTTKVLNSLDEMKRREPDKYRTFYEEMGVFLKEGAYQDWNNREKLAELLLFESTRTEPGKLTTLAEYVERMPGEQTEIYFLAGEGRELLEQSPLLESFRAKGWEVLLLSEAADEFVCDGMREYKGKKLRPIDKAGLEQGEVSDERKQEFKPMLDFLKEKLDVKEARLTGRLKESAVCLVADEGALSAHMERMLQRMGRAEAVSKRVLEVNPEHPVVQALRQLVERDRNDPRAESYARLLYDQALILEGSKVKDPLDMARRMNELMLKNAG